MIRSDDYLKRLNCSRSWAFFCFASLAIDML